MKLYNTLTRVKEEFVPINKDFVSIYSCGPTVYNFAHIGNLRTYIFMDLLRRVLTYNRFSLKHIMNITDVGHLVSDGDDGEDKMLKGAREQQKTPWEIAQYYTGIFMDDIASLNIETPEIIAKATEHIPEMIDFVKILIDKGYAYIIEDGIYFDVQKFKQYGKLSRINLDDLLAGARIEVNEQKHHPADFALWKNASKEHIMQWESPWGMGYPGWHIECSAMSLKYLGEVFDIHTGGVDHVPIHHENEIAQSEALIGKKHVNYWLHGEFMLVNNGKMSKSLGNTYTLKDLEATGISHLAFRYFCLNAHYRNKLNFTWEGINSANIAFERFVNACNEHKNSYENISKEFLESVQKDFEDAINDDINIPKALGIAWNLIRHKEKSKQIFELLLKMDSVFGLDLNNIENTLRNINSENNSENFDSEILELVEKRQQARKDKDWKKADEMRDALKERGIAIEDGPNGVKIVKI